jgi:uncharacterized membrane protein
MPMDVIPETTMIQASKTLQSQRTHSVQTATILATVAAVCFASIIAAQVYEGFTVGCIVLGVSVIAFLLAMKLERSQS